MAAGLRVACHVPSRCGCLEHGPSRKSKKDCAAEARPVATSTDNACNPAASEAGQGEGTLLSAASPEQQLHSTLCHPQVRNSKLGIRLLSVAALNLQLARVVGVVGSPRADLAAHSC